jgi:hypothetical protein
MTGLRREPCREEPVESLIYTNPRRAASQSLAGQGAGV